MGPQVRCSVVEEYNENVGSRDIAVSRFASQSNATRGVAQGEFLLRRIVGIRKYSPVLLGLIGFGFFCRPAVAQSSYPLYCQGPLTTSAPTPAAHRAHYNAVYMGKHGCRRASARARAVRLGRSRRRWCGTGKRERERNLRQRGLNRKRTRRAILGIRCLSRSNGQQLHAHYAIRWHCELHPFRQLLRYPRLRHHLPTHSIARDF